MNRHSEKYRMLGINIAYYRKIKGLSQLQLAEKIGISRTHLSSIEARNVDKSFSISVLFDIADALEVDVKNLFDFSIKK